MNARSLSIAAAAAVVLALAGGADAQQGRGGGGRGVGGGMSAGGGGRSGLVKPVVTRPTPQPLPIYRFPSTIQGVPAQLPRQFGGPLLGASNPYAQIPVPPNQSRPGWGGGGGGWGGGGDGRWNGNGGNGGFVSVGSGGLAAGGRFDTGNGSVGFVLNSGAAVNARRDAWVNNRCFDNGTICGPNSCPPIWNTNCWWNNGWCSLPYRWNTWPWLGGSWWGNTWTDPYATVYGNFTNLDPFLMNAAQPQPPAQQQPARELTALEKADLTLQFGSPAQAADMFRAYLAKNPDDAPAMRSLAIALLDDRRVDQSIAMLAMAYQHRPQLAMSPIDPDFLSGDDTRHRARFNTIMAQANRTKTSSAFFAAAVIAQSEGRLNVAQRLLDRATAAGLDKTVAAEMKMVLTR